MLFDVAGIPYNFYGFFSPSLKLNAVSLPNKTGQKIYPVKISIVEKEYLFR